MSQRNQLKQMGRFAGWLLLLGLGSLFFFGTGCVGPEAYGERAMEAGDYDLALEYYQDAIREGSRDPNHYYQAAIAAQNIGAFGQAERYFSQALRYGGGIEVARALAAFYVQTNNFVQAARVFQYLLRIEENVQPIYSNLGTALMYGGKYLDAETHLILAQQMDPADPVPYINLGVLYDQHLGNPPRAVRFYECFTELGTDTRHLRVVRTRLMEIESQRPVDTSRVNLECGVAFRVGQTEHHDLREIFDLGFGGENGGVETAGDEPIIVEHLDPPPRLREERPEPEAGAGRLNEEDIAELSADAESAFEAGRFDDALRALEAIPEESRTFEDRALLGRSYHRVGRLEEAAVHLEAVLADRPTPQRAEELLTIYGRMGAEEQKSRLCQRFAQWPDYQEVLTPCRP